MRWLYDISADGGKTYTAQWLTEEEAKDEKEMYDHIVLKRKTLLIPEWLRRATCKSEIQ